LTPEEAMRTAMRDRQAWAVESTWAARDLPRILESDLLTTAGFYELRRTWRERLLSWPWRPLVAKIKVPTQVPRDDVFDLGPAMIPRTYVCHPSVASYLRHLIEQETIAQWGPR
jgi:hypothetical protein